MHFIIMKFYPILISPRLTSYPYPDFTLRLNFDEFLKITRWMTLLREINHEVEAFNWSQTFRKLGHDQLVTKLLTGEKLTGIKTNWIFSN